jgi:hypothetical protein
LASDGTWSKVFIRDGEVSQAGGVLAALVDRKNVRIFKPGERVYVSKVSVKDDEIWFFIHSCDTHEVNRRGTTQQTRYKSLLSFQFAKDSLATANFNDLKKVIDSVITSEEELQTQRDSQAPKSNVVQRFLFVSSLRDASWQCRTLGNYPAVLSLLKSNVKNHNLVFSNAILPDLFLTIKQNLAARVKG